MASPTFLGHVEEPGLLEAARRRAADGEPAVVLVGGEAGVGKTRLVGELTSRCATDGTRVLAGGCVPVGEGALPYAPVVEMLRALLADLGAGAVRELVGPSWPEVARLLPALGAPDRIGLSEQAAQARLFELLLGLLGRLGEEARWCWWSRTCTGPTAPPATCWPSWSATSGASESSWWPPTATTSRASSGWGRT